jgi:hypothetical protein
MVISFFKDDILDNHQQNERFLLIFKIDIKN